jgi:hypothetical protein
MSRSPRILYIDLVDPLSYVAHRAAREQEAGTGLEFERVGVELRPFPSPLTDAEDPFWAPRWAAAHRAAPDVRLVAPALVPWSSKAHELVVLAAERGVGATVLDGVFRTFFEKGEDIGRIDVLVGIAEAAGLDRTETKAALDVDRWQERVVEARRTAAALGVSELPAIQVGERIVQGFHNLPDLGTCSFFVSIFLVDLFMRETRANLRWMLTGIFTFWRFHRAT